MSSLFDTVRDDDGESISDMLAKFGVRHEPGYSHSNGQRYLYTERGCIGRADAKEAINLLALLLDAPAAIDAAIAKARDANSQNGQGPIRAETPAKTLGSQKPSPSPNNRGEMSPGVNRTSVDPTSLNLDDDGGP